MTAVSTSRRSQRRGAPRLLLGAFTQTRISRSVFVLGIASSHAPFRISSVGVAASGGRVRTSTRPLRLKEKPRVVTHIAGLPDGNARAKEETLPRPGEERYALPQGSLCQQLRQLGEVHVATASAPPIAGRLPSYAGKKKPQPDALWPGQKSVGVVGPFIPARTAGRINAVSLQYTGRAS